MINQISNSTTNPYQDFRVNDKNPNFFIQNKPPQKEEKKSYIAAMSIGITALVIGFGILGLMRISPKKLTGQLEKLKKLLEEQLENSRHKNNFDQLTKAHTAAIQKINSIIMKAESVNNFTSVKDAMFKKIMDKTPFTKRIHQGITKLFTKIGRSTVIASWANTKHKFGKNFEILDKIDNNILTQKGHEIIEINGVKKSGKEWLEVLKQHKNNILKTLNENTASSPTTKREGIMSDAVNNLDKVILNELKEFKNGNLYKEFIADRRITQAKDDMFSEMFNFRKQISFSTSDKLRVASNALQKAENALINSDFATSQEISRLKKLIKQGNKEKFSEIFNEKFSTITDKIKDKKALQYLDTAREILQDNTQGEFQHMLSIYKKLAPNDYEKITKAINSSVKALDSSINIEGVQYFEKLRDLNIGSAPTDILSILGSSAYLTYALTNTKDNDEKYSLLLKQGIPVLTTLSVSLLCAARLIAGGKAMATGLLSGYVMKKGGDYADKIRKQYAENHNNKTTPKTV